MSGGMVFVVIGYVGLIAVFKWWGVLAAGIHIVALLLASPGRK